MAWQSRRAFFLCAYLLRLDDVFRARFRDGPVLRSQAVPHLSAFHRSRALGHSRRLTSLLGVGFQPHSDAEPYVCPRFVRQHLELAYRSADVSVPAFCFLVCPKERLDYRSNVCGIHSDCSLATAPHCARRRPGLRPLFYTWSGRVWVIPEDPTSFLCVVCRPCDPDDNLSFPPGSKLEVLSMDRMPRARLDHPTLQTEPESVREPRRRDHRQVFLWHLLDSLGFA